LQQYKDIDNFKNVLYENVRSLMELMKESWSSIMMMPYKFFLDTLKWKIDLEDEKRKRLEENKSISGHRTPNNLRKG